MGQDSERAIGFELGMINNLTRRCLNQRFAENGLEDLGGIQGPVILKPEDALKSLGKLV